MAVGWFYLSVLALCSLGSMCVLFTIYWMRYWHGGFAWDGSMLMFNWHPVLMVTGMVVLYSAGECGLAGDTCCGPSPCAAVLLSSWPLLLKVQGWEGGMACRGLSLGPADIWKKLSRELRHLRRATSQMFLGRGLHTSC